MELQDINAHAVARRSELMKLLNDAYGNDKMQWKEIKTDGVYYATTNVPVTDPRSAIMELERELRGSREGNVTLPPPGNGRATVPIWLLDREDILEKLAYLNPRRFLQPAAAEHTK